MYPPSDDMWMTCGWRMSSTNQVSLWYVHVDDICHQPTKSLYEMYMCRQHLNSIDNVRFVYTMCGKWIVHDRICKEYSRWCMGDISIVCWKETYQGPLQIMCVLYAYAQIICGWHVNMQITCEQCLDVTCRENHQHTLSRKSFIWSWNETTQHLCDKFYPITNSCHSREIV